jgi:hypothetical protein
MNRSQLETQQRELNSWGEELKSKLKVAQTKGTKYVDAMTPEHHQYKAAMVAVADAPAGWLLGIATIGGTALVCGARGSLCTVCLPAT